MITVLRIGHRIHRDKRITTHVALVARAFGADQILIDTLDKKLEESIIRTCKYFGGNFKIKTGINPKKTLKEWKGKIAHLTMYGEKLEKSIKKIDEKSKLLIVIGAEKVPAYIYDIADYNVSIGNQPHSEVAALAIFLDRYTDAKWLNKKFNGKIQIQPSNKGKNVLTIEK
ncbi:MAG: tRNA (cytidine(56)-2'-O)-methyltransferase [Thermoplasmatales archaeon]|jgi:tRNA (cytidine56-2'-O)-methyltransferase|nr:MAG: tRNA (cytidine(56)-2'-O)-methyltransferase [Thermoplasmatales archaeon]